MPVTDTGYPILGGQPDWGWKRPLKNGLAGAKPAPSADGGARRRGTRCLFVLRMPVVAFLPNNPPKAAGEGPLAGLFVRVDVTDTGSGIFSKQPSEGCG